MLLKELLVLNEVERKHKNVYLADRERILFSPLRFEDYSRLLDEEKHYFDYRQFYQQTSREGKGLTITRNVLYEDTTIYVSRHTRYAFPILHNHDFIELVYVMNGSCINYINGQAIAMHKGDFCFLAPEAVHALLAVNDDDVIINMLLWKESMEASFADLFRRDCYITDFFKQLLLGKHYAPYMIFHTDGDRKILNQVLRLYGEFLEKDVNYIEMIGYILNEIFIDLNRNYLSTLEVGKKENYSSKSSLYPMLSLIRLNYQTITLTTLAKQFSYSESYLSKLIKKNTGKTFKSIVEEARIDNAKKLLLTTTLSLTEISQKAGYFDSSHMNRDFIKWLGVSPKKWLESQSKDDR
ncbi:AraC family transcriptional regulator [Streptococcus sp. S784/96/1]|uniref:AraC family transcriptional regulator n=1 Tax=Streptococcus sp. S784/96/1 TaxID=2653499 RepID=UPI001387259F|nr:AraC family transcriptional regulator [Streptococcus sp. S784/96/1]